MVIKAFDKGTTTEDIAQSISPGLRKKAVAGKFNGQLVDLTKPLETDGSIEIVTPGSEEALEVLRHSTAHLMAHAIKRLYGGVGPVIEGGFYYDFDIDQNISSDDFEQIEKTMKQIVNENMKIERKVVSRDEAKELFSNDEYKLELIDAIPEDENVTLYIVKAILLIYVVEFTFHQQLKLKSLNYYLQQVHTGVEIVTTKCYNVYTVLLSLIKKN